MKTKKLLLIIILFLSSCTFSKYNRGSEIIFQSSDSKLLKHEGKYGMIFHVEKMCEFDTTNITFNLRTEKTIEISDFWSQSSNIKLFQNNSLITKKTSLSPKDKKVMFVIQYVLVDDDFYEKQSSFKVDGVEQKFRIKINSSHRCIDISDNDESEIFIDRESECWNPYISFYGGMFRNILILDDKGSIVLSENINDFDNTINVKDLNKGSYSMLLSGQTVPIRRRLKIL